MVRATPFDGVLKALREASIVISNTTPTISNVQITPTTPVVPIHQCVASAVDEDDGALSVSYEWFN